jgi:tRNA(adenine34) deaminase
MQTNTGVYIYCMKPVDADQQFMREALKLARRAAEKEEVPVGAVVVCEGKIIAKGYNQVEALHDATAHAEMIALSAASEYYQNKYLAECTVYVTLEPCPMCAAALGLAQVRRLVYGAADSKKGYTLFSHRLLHPKTKVSAGSMAGESSALLKNFFASRRK